MLLNGLCSCPSPQVPLVIRAILQIGTRASLKDSAPITFNKAKQDGFDFADLERTLLQVDRHAYLQGGTNFNYIFLFHLAASPYHVFGLFLPTGDVKVYVVHPNKKDDPWSQIQDTYTTWKPQHTSDQQVYEYPNTLHPDVSHHASEGIALEAVSRELKAVDIGKVMLVISSTKELPWFEEGIPHVSRFPLLFWQGSVRANPNEARLWQRETAEQMIRRYLGMGAYVRRIIREAAHYDIPVGNIPDNGNPPFYIDVEFARSLWRQDMIIWWSSNGKPDLGGREADYVLEDDPNPEIQVPGCYSNVCVSVLVKKLAVTAVVQSGRLEESAAAVAGEVPLGHITASTEAFAVLREMVALWADPMGGSIHDGLDYLWAWLSSPASHMFDPELRHHVHILMCNMFRQLVAEIQRFGSKVIAADFATIIISTPKAPGTATAYVNYILSSVNSREPFKGIDLRLHQFFDFLLYMDGANIGGVPPDDPDAVDPPQRVPIVSQWNIATFLPDALQRMFKDVIMWFIHKLYRTTSTHTNSSRLALSEARSDLQLLAAEKIRETSAIRTFLSGSLTKRMLREVTEINRKMEDAHTFEAFPNELRFPLLPGSHLTMSDPPLEYIKFTCAVFQLLKGFDTEVGLLKKALLLHIGVKAFSPEANFQNPCDSFRLPVVCRICNTLRDLDFCRDPDLLPSDYHLGTANIRWLCLVCDSEYDRPAIEAKLIDLVRRLRTQFQLQDLRCTKCKEIKSDSLSLLCKCGGTYAHTIPKAQSRRKLRTILNVAIFHNLPLLRVRHFEAHRLELPTDQLISGLFRARPRPLVDTGFDTATYAMYVAKLRSHKSILD